MSFEDDLAKAQEAAASPNTSGPIPVMIGDTLYELTFEQARGEDWAAVTAKHPMRLEQPIDRTYGYNFHAVVAEIAETTCTITRDGQPVTLIVERWSKEKPQPKNQWRDLFAVVDGSAYIQLADAAFELNQWGPDQRVAAAKKALRPASEPSSD